MARTGSRLTVIATCLLAIASFPISVGREPLYDALLYPLNAIVLGAAGALVAHRQPRNPIAWVLAGMGHAAAWVEVTEGYGYHPRWPGATTVEWVTNWGTMIGIGMTGIVLALFPSGRDLSPVRRALVGAGVVATTLMTLGAAFTHSSDASFAGGENPYAVDGWSAVPVAGQVLFTVTLLASIATIVHRFVRSSGVEHQQLKWIAYAVGLLAVVAPLAIFWYDDSPLVRVAIAFAVTAWPCAVCVAILRYRLYDIDVIITRTVVYGALTLLLAGSYVTVVVALGAVLGGRSPWVTAGATATVAVAFRPLSSWLQDVVDRRFRRARYAALARVDAFLDDLRAGRADPGSLASLLREVMDRPELEVHYLVPGRTHTPPDATGLPRARHVVVRAGVPLAEVRFADIDEDASSKLLEEVVDRAGLAFEIARLQAEVQHRLAEVEASRARIVAAGHEERRRLSRDLHDGAQQRLVSVGLALRHAQFELGESPVVLTIDSAIDQLAVAIGDLRELANGVRPAFLGHGLDVALRELAGRTPMPVHVRAGTDRYPSDVEATAYFVACEGLTNAVKHADATGVDLCVRTTRTHLVLEVSDDGVGGALLSGGTGLRGLCDRVAAHGGRLQVQSRPGLGTTLIAELPCAS